MTAIAQYAFDPLTVADESGMILPEAAKVAKAQRDARLRELRREGANCKGWTLEGQLRKYRSMGVEDGRVRSVYYITVYPATQ